MTCDNIKRHIRYESRQNLLGLILIWDRDEADAFRKSLNDFYRPIDVSLAMESQRQKTIYKSIKQVQRSTVTRESEIPTNNYSNVIICS